MQSTQDLESLSMVTRSTPKLAATRTAQAKASASAWRGIVVLTFLVKANTTIPLQSLATIAIVEKSQPIATSQFSFTSSPKGFYQHAFLTLGMELE
jgi:hypothetical protein